MQALRKVAKLSAWLGAAVVLGAGLCTVRASRAATRATRRELEDLRARTSAHAERAARLDHDLRTPIGTLMSALELVKSQPEDAALRAEALAVMARQAARMTALAETMQALARDLATDRRR